MAAAAMAQVPAGGRKLKTRLSKDIAASPLSIGFETLDRSMFDPERTYSHLAELGVKWARCQTGWARTEKTKGSFDFTWLDNVVDSLAKIGVQPWFNLGYGNRLYTPKAPNEFAVGWAPIWGDEPREAWVRFVENISDRYRTRVKHWELWNEPNIPNFWQPEKPNPAEYVELVKLTAPIIRKRVPGCTLIGGAFAGTGAMDYFEGCMHAGMGDHVDKISYHPYRARPELNYASDIRAMRSLFNRYKPGVALWQGENGAPSQINGSGALANLEWDEQRQARWLLRRIVTDLASGIELTSYFHTVDMVNYIWHTGQSDKTNFKGVLRGREYTRKPAYYAYQNLCTLLDSTAKPADLLCRFESPATVDEMAVQSATFTKGETPLYLYWTASDLQKPYTPGAARVNTWGGKAVKLENPVMVDLLTGEVKQPPKAERRGGWWAFDSAPVEDYPILITDASLVS
jgi:hypothetical protein